MAEANCPHHTDHDNRIKKLEDVCDNLDDRITKLDKESAVNRVEITGSLKNLEKLPETMLQISNTMIIIQNEIKASNTLIDNRIKGVETKIDSTFLGVDKRIKDLNGKVSVLDNKVIKSNELDTINLRQALKNWFVKNWAMIGFGILIAGLFLTDLIKDMVFK